MPCEVSRNISEVDADEMFVCSSISPVVGFGLVMDTCAVKLLCSVINRNSGSALTGISWSLIILLAWDLCNHLIPPKVNPSGGSRSTLATN